MHSKALYASLAGLACALWLAVPGASAGLALRSHGQLIQVRANTDQSSNWFGYNQGSLALGGTLFNSIGGDWIVPTASEHAPGQAAYSSDWIGIGGGCVDSGCTVGDETLIQTGTEQDSDGTYGAWWELVPAPSISISMTVAPGDHMHASIAEIVPFSDVWTITLQDVTRNETFTQTVPYPSTHLTAEWIEETPLLLGANAGFAALPNLTTIPFSNATVNGQNANLDPSQEIQLIDSNGNVIGAPSAPNSTRNGFDVCAWATVCS
ncbi:MAG TPA: G1 family glutamic endopeptidase [Gaiellaceae bacterium]|nr:G1 family glutamic endopeptidase [Gaiellaceae bacterium]